MDDAYERELAGEIVTAEEAKEFEDVIFERLLKEYRQVSEEELEDSYEQLESRLLGRRLRK